MKLITPGVFDLIKLSADGKFPGGNYFGPTGLVPSMILNDVGSTKKSKITGQKLTPG